MNLSEVEELLRGVTPGPWTEHDKGKHPNSYVCGATGSYEHGDDQPVVAYVVGMNVEPNRRFIAWCREGVPALIALATAQAAQIAGHDGQRRDLERVIRNQRRELRRLQALERVHWDSVERWKAQREGLTGKASAAETALAAERAKVERLRGAMTEKAVRWIKEGMVIVAPDGVPQRRALDSYRKQFAGLVRAALEAKHE